MSVFYNPDRSRWMFDFRQNGRRRAGYCLDAAGEPVTSRRAAVEAEGAQRRHYAEEMARAADGEAIDAKIPKTADLTLAQVIDDLIPQWEGKADWPNKQRYIREVLTYFKPHKRVRDISEAELEDFRTWLIEQRIMIWTGGSSRDRNAPGADKFWKPSGKTRSAATANRHLPILRAVFARAHKVRDPKTGKRALEDVPKIGKLPVLKRKARPIPEDVLQFIMTIAPRHVCEAMIATLYFGFRRGEIFERGVGDVDFEFKGIWLDAEHVKDDEDAFIPGSPDAMAFMRELVDQANDRGTDYLITWRVTHNDPGAQAKEPWLPIRKPKSAWRTVQDQVEAKFGRRYRWHDIRASFISYVAIRSGRAAAQALARHSDYRTTEAYVHVADDLQRAAANRVARRPVLKLVRTGKSQTAVPNSVKRKSKNAS